MYLVAVFGVILSVWLLVPQTLAAPVARSADKTPWKLHEALSAGGQVKGFNGTWISENEFYYTAADRTIHIFNAETLKDRVLVSDELLEAYSGGTFILSPDTKRILIRYGLEQVFRHSYIAKYDIYVIESSEIKKIHGGEKLQLCTWATVGERLSYVFNNNVYVRLEDGRELQITTDGVNGEVYNGIADWVYEEEVLSTSRAMWWSPDATLMAVASFNDTGVQTFSYTIYGESEDAAYQYPKEEKLKYPKPGTPNPIVSLKVYDLSTPSPTVESIPAPVGIVSADHILQSVVWSGKEALLVTWLNRRQNLGTIQSCTKRGVCREVTPLAEPKGWVSVSQPKCLSNENNCLLLNWIGNWYQIWNVDLATGKNVWSSRGDFTVTGLYGYDEAKDQVYYQATLQGDPSQYHIYRSGTCLSCHLKDADGETCRQASATFSKDFSFYTITCTGPGPSYTSVFNAANTAIKPWQLNTEFRDYLEQKLQPTVKYLNVSLGGGFTGYARLALPPGLNWDNPDKSVKYPMIVNVYGGPNSVRANSAFRVGYEAYVVTKRNIIYATIDGRGTGNKGKDLLFTVNNNLGEHEVEDQIGVAKQLQEAYSFIDASRTAIWGWSYGGYVSAKTLANDTKNVFQCGVSVAPVTSWIYYDSIYTERYMGLPTDEDNLINYHYSSIMENVENFKTHDFLLIHGSGDDNVHYQQSLMLARVLQRKDILFSQMTYTDESHSIGNFLPHLYNTIDSFFSDCLGIEASNDDDEDNDVSG